MKCTKCDLMCGLLITWTHFLNLQSLLVSLEIVLRLGFFDVLQTVHV